jgi:hypothetical protein
MTETMTETKSEFDRIREAYLAMAKQARYRPQSPRDGGGNIQLSEKEARNQARLESEASEYAEIFLREEERTVFYIGVSNWETNRAFVYTIEAARLLCGTATILPTVRKLLEMALEDVRRAERS